jgi:hypothetical protein
MSLKDSPSLQDFSPVMPEPRPQSQGRKRSWIVIGVLAVIVLAMGTLMFLRSDSGAILRGTGSISGRVMDTQGNLLYDAEVFVGDGQKSTRTDANGNFLLQDVPVGSHVLVAGYQGWGVEHSVTVLAGSTLDAGTLVIEVLENE